MFWTLVLLHLLKTKAVCTKSYTFGGCMARKTGALEMDFDFQGGPLATTWASLCPKTGKLGNWNDHPEPHHCLQHLQKQHENICFLGSAFFPFWDWHPERRSGSNPELIFWDAASTWPPLEHSCAIVVLKHSFLTWFSQHRAKRNRRPPKWKPIGDTSDRKFKCPFWKTSAKLEILSGSVWPFTYHWAF